MTSINMQDPAERDYFLCAQLKGQLKIIRAGMTIRNLTKSQAMKRATDFTQRKYKAGQIDLAITDLEARMENALKVAQVTT